MLPHATCRERQQQLEMLGYDMERLDATVVEFMANGKILSQVLADGGGNLTVLAYDKMVSKDLCSCITAVQR